jgi:hypothetical protein
MSRKNIPTKFNKENRKEEMSPFRRFPINILEEEIKEGKIQQSPTAPAKYLAQPISVNSLLHYTNLDVKSSIKRQDLISGESNV